MSEKAYEYIIVGGGLSGGSAAAGIREVDKDGSVLLAGSEPHRPYDRPPLSKKLWFGQKKVEEIFVQAEPFYSSNGIDLKLGEKIVRVDPRGKTVTDGAGTVFHYDKLLLATGGTPKRLGIPGGDLEGIYYYRYLDDYLALRKEVSEGKSAVVIGGGFIGSEMAAALNVNKVEVTMVYPDAYLVSRVFPEGLGLALQDRFVEKGVKVLSGDLSAVFERKGDGFVTRTKNGKVIGSDILLVGVGIAPSIELAEGAGLQTGDGIVVDSCLQTSSPDIYAAGDIANFPYQALGRSVRIEHWDNSVNQGAHAGRNMAGAADRFRYMPYFFSDLFEFGYEAVGDVNSRLETFADWQKENDTGVIYYLEGGKVRGAMMCNVWDRVPDARALIGSGQTVSPSDLRGAIR